MLKRVSRTPQVMKAVKHLSSMEVLVGIPSTTAGRTDTPINNAEIGYLMETGSPAQNIPERPFLVPGVENATKQFVPHLKAAGKAALAGNIQHIERDLDRAGFIAATAVRAKINSNIPPPLSPRTIYKRKHRKEAPRQGEQTLVDTGNLREAIIHVVIKTTNRRR